MRNIKNKVVYGKFGTEGDIDFLKGAIEGCLGHAKYVKGEIRQLWKEIYERKKKIKALKLGLKNGEEYRAGLEQKIKDLRTKIEQEKNKNRVKF